MGGGSARESLASARGVENILSDGEGTGLVASGGCRTPRSPSLSRSHRQHSVLHAPTMDPDMSYRDSGRASSLVIEEEKSLAYGGGSSADFGRPDRDNSASRSRLDISQLVGDTPATK